MTARSEALGHIRRLAELERRTRRGTATPDEAAEYAALIGSREPWASSVWMVAWMSGASYTEVRDTFGPVWND